MTLDWTDSSRAVLSHPAVGEIVCQDGDVMTIHPAPEVTLETIRPFVMGVGFALLMTMRGYLVVHASTVARDGCGIAFAGASGMGKSVMTADQIQGGAYLVADDLMVISRQPGGEGMVVWRGTTSLRLGMDVLSHMGIEAAHLPIANPTTKRYWTSSNVIKSPCVPLVSIYVLDTADVPSVEPLRGAQAMLELLRHVYLVPYLRQLSAEQNVLLASAAQSIQVQQLVYPRDLERLAEVRRLIASP